MSDPGDCSDLKVGDVAVARLTAGKVNILAVVALTALTESTLWARRSDGSGKLGAQLLRKTSDSK